MTLGGCDRAPQAGAAATVNGDVISRADLAAEARGTGTGTDDRASQRALLSEVVDRKLLAQEAVAQKLDQSPEFKAAERKARETLLAEALVARLNGGGEPGKAAVAKFVADNPAMFAAREVLSLDQLQVAAAAVDGAWLRPANNLADAAAILQAHHVPFQRGHATADTAALPPPLLKVLTEHPNDPFAVPQGDKLVISQVTGRQRAPVPPEQANAVAAAELRRRALGQATASTLAELRAKATVSYGEGFSAPAVPAAGGGGR